MCYYKFRLQQDFLDKKYCEMHKKLCKATIESWGKMICVQSSRIRLVRLTWYQIIYRHAIFYCVYVLGQHWSVGYTIFVFQSKLNWCWSFLLKHKNEICSLSSLAFTWSLVPYFHRKCIMIYIYGHKDGNYEYFAPWETQFFNLQRPYLNIYYQITT